MKRYRISKYSDYIFKHTDWLDKEWTDYSEVGEVIHGEVLTLIEYERVENNYLLTIRNITEHLKINEVVIRNYIDASGIRHSNYDGKLINVEEMLSLLKRMLRNEFWCEFSHKRFHLNLGWDYVIYLSCNMSLNSLKKICEKHGLYCAEYWDK